MKLYLEKSTVLIRYILTLTCHHTYLNSLPAIGESCHLLITFANSSEPDQAQQNVGPDLDQNSL